VRVIFPDNRPRLFEWVALLALAWHAWQCVSYPGVTNLRSSIAVTFFAGVAAFATRVTDRREQVLPLRLFATAGLLLLIVFVEITGRRAGTAAALIALEAVDRLSA
jgi:hypothetical protein